MAGKFELYTDNAGEFRFRLKAGNGENILASEGYKQKSSAENGIESVRKNAGDDARYERKETSSGKHMFNLKAANGQVIGTSQSYASASGRDGGIESVKKNAPEAALDDQTG
ncbi:YegP family protein [Leisingera sp. McT4-56]|uniref:YegP family protein n=1 Tax=Leisingera sp. McT4-56 TaxID=2881255 RepID=UPI001CF869A5|nr:YegP family protein [Leisingera sp. McT4-56]MCB4457567.1 YegP family protein [Leisingera sp. McT4-56]